MQQPAAPAANTPPVLSVTPSNCLYLGCLRKANELIVYKRYSGLRKQGGALVFSSGLHRALRDVYDPQNGPPPNLQNLAGYIRAAFLRQPYPDAAAREHDVCRAAKIIAEYVDADDDAAYTIAVERTGIYQVRAGDLIYELHARLDRALVRPSEPDVLVVRDYKIGRLSLEPEQVTINLDVAKMLWPHFRAYCLEVDGLVDGGETERLVYHSRECKGIISSSITPRVRRFAQATEMLAEPGEACMYCGAKQGCPAHTQAPIDAASLDFED